ncbi:unnamed protein product [Owenia fusiformis]|uniref:15-hydroxyprostaglandin dehydrogenase [NAD(+)] n=1 Tax=Owenia fusiformis TaxID=6347 RepID=A0A8J1UKZ1_OWEFU|nr:unnamed protein product [Owenia fusiformis]
MKIQGSVAIVTGAARGLGKGIAEELLKRGAKVCIADINKGEGEAAAGTLATTFGQQNVFFQECDVTKDEHIRGAFCAAKTNFGAEVNILVNNCGIVQEDNVSLTLAVNAEAPIRSTFTAIELMGRHNGGAGGVVITTSSFQGLIPFGFMPVYSASKHAIVGFVRSIVESPDFSDWGMRFNCICPGGIDTPMLKDEYLEGRLSDKSFAIVRKLLTTISLLRPSEVALGCIKLIEDDTLNGKALLINHGETGEGEVAYTVIDPPTDKVRL